MSKVYRVRMTVGGDTLYAYQDVCSTAVSIFDAKVHINSTISVAHKVARYCTADIKFLFNNWVISVYVNSSLMNSPRVY